MQRGGLLAIHTPEYQRFAKSAGGVVFGKCPYCRKYTRPVWRLHGEPLSGVSSTLKAGLSGIRLLDSDTTMQCQKCQAEWRVFDDRQGARPPAVASAGIEFVETGLSKDLYRETDRLFDNRDGSTAATQRVSITEQWTQTVLLEGEHAQTSSGRIGLTVPLSTLEAKAEETLRRKYEVSERGQRTYTDELTVEVPPYTTRRLHLEYSRVFQTGLVRAAMSDGTSIELPYRVAIALEMDWSQHDTAASRAPEPA